MRRSILGLVLLVASGCLVEVAGPTWDWTAEADALEAKAFCDRWSQLSLDKTPQGALARARMALEGMPTMVAPMATCINPQQLRQQGALDARAAVAGLPSDPQAWLVMAGYQARFAGDTTEAAKAACKAYELAPKNAGAAEACGIYLKQVGDEPGAVAALKAAVMASTDREQQFELMETIEQTSIHPKTDLESLPPELVERYRAHQMEKAAHAHRFEGGWGH